MIDLQAERQRKAFKRVDNAIAELQRVFLAGLNELRESLEDLPNYLVLGPRAEGSMSPQLVDVDRAAEILDVNRSTIFGWVNAGELEFVALPSVKGDKPIRKFSVDQLEAFKARHTMSVAS